MSSLNSSEALAVSQALHGIEPLLCVAARLYLADEQRGLWRLESTGAAVVASASSGPRPTVQVHLIDLKTRRSVFSVNAGGADWRYYQDKPFFHSFPSQRDSCFAALSFAEEAEAEDFASALAGAVKSMSRASIASAYSSPSYSQPPAQPPRNSAFGNSNPQPNLAVPPTINKSSSAPMGTPVPTGPISLSLQSSSGTGFNGLKKPAKDDSDVKKTESNGGSGFFGFGRKKTAADASSTSTGNSKTEKKKKKNGGNGKIDKSMISAPSNFEHVSHVGFNQNTGFTAQNIPMEWKAIFAKAGITEEQLNDKHTAKVVKKFMKANS
ncbi:hypothetical protein HDU83_006185, partial [Entophlyctis luteolus]